jgi:O-antigen ligase/polysaccharide polymerase Wzy-like membrane protein
VSAAVLAVARGSHHSAHGRRASFALAVVCIVLAAAYAIAILRNEAAPILAAVLAAAVVGFIVLVRPIAGVYLLFGAAILFEQFEITGLAPLTAQTHFFENLSSWSQVPLRLSLSDLLALTTLASWAARRVVGTNEPARGGPLAWAIFGYALVFPLGATIGVARGGGWDLITTLAEARGGLYLCLLYFLAANLVRKRGQLMILVWEFVLIVGVKAAQGIGNFAETLNLPDRLDAVTAHEDVVFFDAMIALAILMIALHVRGRLFYALLALQPLILLVELLTQRRSAFAALAGALVIVALISFVEQPRKTMMVIGVALLVMTVYAGAFWNSTSRIAEPVRFIKEIVDPSALSWRDQGSDAWRQIENANIAYTVRQLPLTGVGLGQQYLFQQEPPALTNFVYWRYITHNAVLWVWLKAGPYGAFAFWLLVAQVVMRGLRLYRRLDEPFLRAAVAFPVLLTVVQVIFSSVDEGLTYNRTMTVLGVALGLLAPLSSWAGQAALRPAGASAGQRNENLGTRIPASRAIAPHPIGS